MGNLKQLIIILDSSTGKKNGETLGPSSCYWEVYVYIPSKDRHPTSSQLTENLRYQSAILMEATGDQPIRSGFIYNNYDTPTKMFYDGIVRALEACFYLLKKYDIKQTVVLGDCKVVIDQINGVGYKPKSKSIVALYNQVHHQVSDYKNISFKHINKSDYPLYKKIDSFAKEARGLMQMLE